MSLADMAGGLLGKLGGGAVADTVLKSLGPAVVQTLLDRLNESGYGAQVNSWLGRGANEPITAEELRTALGDEKVQEIARQAGIPPELLAKILAEALPPAAEKAAQQGLVSAPGGS